MTKPDKTPAPPKTTEPPPAGKIPPSPTDGRLGPAGDPAEGKRQS